MFINKFQWGRKDSQTKNKIKRTASDPGFSKLKIQDVQKIKLLTACTPFDLIVILKLTEVTPNGSSGQIAPWHAVEEDATAIDSVPTLCHWMGEETVQVLDRRVRLRNVVLLHAPVRIHICPRCDHYLSHIIVFFVFYSGGGRDVEWNTPDRRGTL